MNPNLCLIKEDFYKRVEEKEILDEFIENDGADLLMKVDCCNQSDLEVYQFFCENKAKSKEFSRIKFFSVENFPDGIFMVFKNDSVDVHVCELKKTPANKLLQLSRQLFSGFMHSKLLLKMLDYEESEISFYYHVFLINDTERSAEYNRLSNLPRKTIPGRKVIKSEDYEKWKRSRVEFEEKDYQLTFTVNKYFLQKEESENTYTLEFNI